MKYLDMRILNLTPDSFYEPSRFNMSVLDSGADIVDIGAVSTRPGAAFVSEEEEWERLERVLEGLKDRSHPRISIDSWRSGIIGRAIEYVPDLIVNDISAGENDPGMLDFVGAHGLCYIAMHKRGNPRSMDSLCTYPEGVMTALKEYFEAFSKKAQKAGIKEWILDPGLGFAKTPEQCWEILERLEELSVFGRPILIGASDKRFNALPTGYVSDIPGLSAAECLALRGGAAILRRH